MKNDAKKANVATGLSSWAAFAIDRIWERMVSRFETWEKEMRAKSCTA